MPCWGTAGNTVSTFFVLFVLFVNGPQSIGLIRADLWKFRGGEHASSSRLWPSFRAFPFYLGATLNLHHSQPVILATSTICTTTLLVYAFDIVIDIIVALATAWGSCSRPRLSPEISLLTWSLPDGDLSVKLAHVLLQTAATDGATTFFSSGVLSHASAGCPLYRSIYDTRQTSESRSHNTQPPFL